MRKMLAFRRRVGFGAIALGIAGGLFHLEAAALEQPTGAFFQKSHVPAGSLKKAWLPNLAALPGGSILCAFAANDPGPQLDSIWVASTPDTGKTWSKPRKIMGLPGQGYIADPNILVVGQRVTVFSTFVPDTTPRYARSETWGVSSTDGGQSWSKPFLVPLRRKYVVGMVHVPVTLPDGTILMGYSWEIGAEEGKPANQERRMDLKSGVLRSQDGGRTWQAGADVYVQEPMGADEPALVVLKNGDVFMIVRTAGPRPYEFRSRDGGRTWGPPRPAPFEGHNSPSALLRLQNGAIMRVWDNSAKNRYPLAASISTDECRTWSRPVIITQPTLDDTGKPSFRTACYPSIAQGKDGVILVVWWETGTFGSRIGYARFSPSWLDSGNPR